MKKMILVLLSAVAVVAVSGCGGVRAGEGDRVVVVNHYEVQETGRGESTEHTEAVLPATESLSSIDIFDLDDGYTIEGFSSYSNGVVLRFYEGRYSYERIDDEGVVYESFSGYFALQNGAIKIYFGDDDGGGYAIETYNGLLEEGYFYDITGVRDDITIASIYRSGAL